MKRLMLMVEQLIVSGSSVMAHITDTSADRDRRERRHRTGDHKAIDSLARRGVVRRRLVEALVNLLSPKSTMLLSILL